MIFAYHSPFERFLCSKLVSENKSFNSLLFLCPNFSEGCSHGARQEEAAVDEAEQRKRRRSVSFWFHFFKCILCFKKILYIGMGNFHISRNCFCMDLLRQWKPNLLFQGTQSCTAQISLETWYFRMTKNRVLLQCLKVSQSRWIAWEV